MTGKVKKKYCPMFVWTLAMRALYHRPQWFTDWFWDAVNKEIEA